MKNEKLDDRLNEYVKMIETLSEENMMMKNEILTLKDLDWKMKDYESKIQILEKNVNQLENYNERIGRDYDFQNRKYQSLINQMRELEDLLEEISARFR